jgi:hypothetical protein
MPVKLGLYENRVYGKKVLMRTFGSLRQEVTVGSKKTG